MEGIVEGSASPAPVIPAVKSPKPRKPRAKASGGDPPPTGSIKVGSNIHFDSQGRQLCSSSAKLCNARSITGYGFCKIHILEDTTAPFKRCEATVSRGKQCNWSVPISQADNRFCAIHVSVEKRHAVTIASSSATESEPTSKTPTTTTTAIKKREAMQKQESEPRLLEPVDLSSDDAETPSYWSEVEGEDDIYPSYLFPALSSTRYFALEDDLVSSGPGTEKITLGDPRFNMDAFLEQRSNQLLHLVKRYRLEMQVLHHAHALHAQDLVMLRARQLARLQNDQELMEHDAKRRTATIEKLYKRKHLEMQQKRPAYADFISVDPNAPSTTDSPAPLAIRSDTPAKHTSTPRGTGPDSAGPKERRLKASAVASPSTPKPSKSLLPLQHCHFDGCSEMALPMTKYCYCHILSDPDQLLFVGCTYKSSEDGPACNYPIVKYTDPSYCAHHGELLMYENGQHVEADEDE